MFLPVLDTTMNPVANNGRHNTAPETVPAASLPDPQVSRECEELARRLLEQCYRRHGVRPAQLRVHADRGAPMKASQSASCSWTCR
jgi:hypothetical protein